MDYQQAYLHLFNAVTDCISLLQRAQQETEEMACKDSRVPHSIFPKSGSFSQKK